MKTGISRPTQGLEDTRAMLRLAEIHGFEGVQFKPDQYADSGTPVTPEVFDQSYGSLARLVCSGLIVYCPADLSAWPAQLLPVFDFAARVGAEQVCVCAGKLGAPHEEAGLRGVSLSLHNHVDSIFESEDDVLRMVDLLDPVFCGLTMDTAHFVKAGLTDLASLIPRIRSHLLNVHLKDLNDAGQFCPLGRGRVDLRSLIEALQAEGYADWLVVDEESKEVSHEEAFAVSRKFLQEVLDDN